MKHFLLFLFLFLVAAAPLSPPTAAADENFSLFEKLSADLATFGKNLGQSPLLEGKFGAARLVSCRTGIQNETTAFLALQIALNPALKMDKPVLTILSSPSTRVDAPLPLALSQTGEPTRFYRNNISFPVFLTFPKHTKTLDVSVTMETQICSDKTCRPHFFSLPLTLKNDSAAPTGMCAAMTEALHFVPTTLPSEKTQAYADSNGVIHLAITLDKAVRTVRPLTITPPAHVKNIRPQGRTILMTLKPATPLQPGDKMRLLFSSPRGFFTAQPTLDAAPLPPLPPAAGWGKILLAGVLFFFFSGCYTLFFRRAACGADYADRLKKAQLIIGLSAPFFIILWLNGFLIPDSLFISKGLMLLWTPLVITALMLAPKKPLLSFGLLFWLLPKPYLADLSASDASTGMFGFFCALFWFFCLLSPLNIARKTPLFFQATTVRQWKAFGPQFLLLLWSAAAIVFAFLPPAAPSFSQEKLARLIHDGKTVLVMVDEPFCLSCAWHQRVQTEIGALGNARRTNNLLTLRLNRFDPAVQDFLTDKNIRRAPAYMLFSDVYPEGIHLPDNLSYYDMSAYLKTVSGQTF